MHAWKQYSLKSFLKKKKLAYSIHVNARLKIEKKKKEKKLSYSVHVNARLKTVFSIITPSSPKLVIISMRL